LKIPLLPSREQGVFFHAPKSAIQKKEERKMKRFFAVSIATLSVCSLLSVGLARGAEKESLGETLFKKHCAVCHPDGNNIVNPQKTLHAKDRAANKIASVDDIVKLMRNPGPGMVKFGQQVVSEKDAKAIAEYILKTFTK
jgi:cytochrome c6